MASELAPSYPQLQRKQPAIARMSDRDVGAFYIFRVLTDVYNKLSAASNERPQEPAEDDRSDQSRLPATP